jgi:hypothetical protein
MIAVWGDNNFSTEIELLGENAVMTSLVRKICGKIFSYSALFTFLVGQRISAVR